MSFTTGGTPCTHHRSQDPEHQFPDLLTLPVCGHALPSPRPLAAADPSSTTTISCSPGCRGNGVTRCIALGSSAFRTVCQWLAPFYCCLIWQYGLATIYSSTVYFAVEGNSDYFWILVIVHRATLNIQIFVWICVHFSGMYVYLGVELLVHMVSECIRNCQTVSQSGCGSLHSHQGPKKIPIASHPF